MSTDTENRPSPWMTTKEVAKYLGISPSFVRLMASEGRGPPRVKFGKRVKYHEAEVDEWAITQHCDPTEQP